MRPNHRSASAPWLHVASVLAVGLVPALLAGCGVARDVEGLAGDGGCTGCHGDRSRSGDPANQPAPADAHVAHLGHGVPCGTCHEVPAAPRHANGTVDVVFSGVALARGARPTYDAATHRCSGVYCHRPAAGGGGRIAAPSWSERLPCDACHGRPPPDHDAADTRCSGCHPGTVLADGTLDDAAGRHVDGSVQWSGAHRAGWSAPDRHGRAAIDDLARCRTCHGRSLDGIGGSARSCEGCHASAGYPGWQSNCTFCHGTKTRAYTAVSLPRAAPPRGTHGETSTTDVAVGAHQAHLGGGALGTAVACDACHAVAGDLLHVDGQATVNFGARAKRHGATPTWNGSTCASTYCHGATLRGGTRAAPSWTGRAQAACGTCHGVPPPSPHSSSRACGSCHRGYTETTVDPALHLNGEVDATGGHEDGWLARHGHEANRGGLGRCKGCHGPSLDGAGGTAQGCSGCHARAGTSSWATSCTFCHGTRGGSAAPPEDTQGGSSRGDVPVGAHAPHLGTGLMNGMSCNVCHPDRAGSNVIGDAAHVDGDGVAEVALSGIARRNGSAGTYARASRTSASCTSVYCHRGRAVSWTSTTRMGCTGCHQTPPGTRAHNGDHLSALACDACHPGYGATYVNRATHIDGNVVFSKTCTSCHRSEDD